MLQRVDIILPNFNSQDTIEKTIKSILKQSYKKWRLILVDDNSNLSTKIILKKYHNHKKIKIYYINKNKGAAFCRNFAIKKSNSNYIAFIDSDDTWKINKLKNQIKFMKTNKVKFSYTWYIAKNISSKITRAIQTPLRYNYDSFIKNTSIATSTMIINSSLAKKIKFPETKICEDYFYKCKLLKKVGSAYCLPEYLTEYKIRKNSLQSKKLRNLFWIWKINKNYNKLNFFKNLISIFLISLNSIKKYGFK